MVCDVTQSVKNSYKNVITELEENPDLLPYNAFNYPWGENLGYSYFACDAFCLSTNYVRALQDQLAQLDTTLCH